MAIVVPDASVLLKWVLPAQNENYVAQALGLRAAIFAGDIRAHVPSLWYYEVGNTLARRFPLHAARMLEVLCNAALDEHGSSKQVCDLSVRLVNDYGVTFYDASYHALALVLDGTFVTSDTRYIERARAAEHVMHLMDWVGK